MSESRVPQKPNPAQALRNFATDGHFANELDARIGRDDEAREFEESLIGCLLLDPSYLSDEPFTQLTLNDFWREDCKIVFKALRQLFDAGEGIDFLTVAGAMELKKEEFKDTLALITRWAKNTPSSFNGETYCNRVLENSAKRQATDAMNKRQVELIKSNGTLDVGTFIAGVQSDLEKINAARQIKGGIIDFRNLEAKEVQYLLPRYVPLGANTLLAADGGVGKTLLLYDLVIGTLTTGSAWGGIPVQRPGPVLILTSDTSEAEFASLMDPLLEARGFSERPEGLFLDFGFYSLADEGKLAYIHGFSRERGIVLVGMDVLATYLGDLSENKKHEVGQVVDPFRSMLRNLGAGGITLHHLNRNYGAPLRQRIRGSGHIFNASTSVLGVKPKEAGRSGVLSQERLRGRMMNPLSFGLEWMDSRAFLTYEESKAGPVEDEQKSSKMDQAILACVSHLQEQKGIWVAAAELLRLCASWGLQISRSGFYKYVVPELTGTPGVNFQEEPWRFQWEG